MHMQVHMHGHMMRMNATPYDVPLRYRPPQDGGGRTAAALQVQALAGQLWRWVGSPVPAWPDCMQVAS